MQSAKYRLCETVHDKRPVSLVRKTGVAEGKSKRDSIGEK